MANRTVNTENIAGVVALHQENAMSIWPGSQKYAARPVDMTFSFFETVKLPDKTCCPCCTLTSRYAWQ
ncbi:hypothetical protein BH11PSE12_BH11PSE12_26840 [soil metagenome]